MLSLGDESLPLDQLLGRLGGEERQQHRGLSPAAGELLSHHISGLALNFLSRDVGSRHFGHYSASRRSAKEVGAAKARDQGNHHEDRNDGQQAAKDNLLDRARGLQKSNHRLITPEYKG